MYMAVSHIRDSAQPYQWFERKGRCQRQKGGDVRIHTINVIMQGLNYVIDNLKYGRQTIGVVGQLLD